MYCDRCGVYLYTKDKFCYRCGKEVPKPPPSGNGESVPGTTAEHLDGLELAFSKRAPFLRQDGPIAPPQQPMTKYGKYGKRIKTGDEVQSVQSKTRRKKNPWVIVGGIVLVYIIIGLSIVLMETVDGDFWYIYTDYFGSKHIIGQSSGTELPAYIRAIETVFYPVLYVFRSLFRL